MAFSVVQLSSKHILLEIILVIWISLPSESIENCTVEGDLRLIGGRHPLEGKLEVCLYNTAENMSVWGTVCNDEWDMKDAMVACRQLGVPEENLSQLVSPIFFIDRTTSAPIHWECTGCLGNETHLINCSRVSEDCVPSEDVGLICRQPNPECENGMVRILDVNERNSTEGRVEVCVGGRWGSICETSDNGWNDADAKVVCRQLGIAVNVPRALSSAQTPNAKSSVPIVFDGVRCGSQYLLISNCCHNEAIEGCNHGDDVGVNCTDVVECHTENEVQLVGGDKPSEGRVEYCKNGLWGSICRSQWDEKDAEVVCRQLQYEGISAAGYIGLNNEHHRRIYIDRAKCVGNESALSECPTDSPNDCPMSHGAAVNCSLEAHCQPLKGVRLSFGILSDEFGVVEGCYGDWGYICDGNQWDDSNAEVVCRQLGLTGGVALKNGILGGMSLDYLLDNVDCTGNEANIADCKHSGFRNHNCGQGEHAVVACGTSQGSPLTRCTAEDVNKTVAVNETSLTVGSLGVCERYAGQSQVCNGVFNMTSDYVFFNSSVKNQNQISSMLDRQLTLVENIYTDIECRDLVRRVVCNFFFAPCGSNGMVHLPRSVCSEECNYVQNVCSPLWHSVQASLGVNNFGSINCSTTSSHLEPLPTCCFAAGIVMQGVPTTSAMGTTVDQTGLIVGGIFGLLFLIFLLLIIAALIFCVVKARRRKVTIRSLQLDVLGRPSSTSFTQLTAGPDIYADCNDLDTSVDVKLRRNGSSSKGPTAVPNPYTKQEIPIHAPLLSPHQANLTNRISSSIIRELSSSMLIPYSRLKLLECVGQGEFGVVYKAHYTVPEGDIGYKTSTVAVKTLKGFFNQDQVNKIMEEGIKMKHFDHPNVLNLVGVCLDAGSAPYVVMPYMANGSLLSYLKNQRSSLVLPVGTDEDVRFDICKRLTVMCMQISNGMEYLAHEKFVHRDLAARNCMIDIHFVIKIADFGLSEDLYAKNYYRQSDSDKTIKLPVKWMAPESLTDGIFSEKSDVWSFGITCWEVFSGGKTPYPGVDPMALSHMLETDQRLSKPFNTACSDEIYKIIETCWVKTPEKRPSFTNLVDDISEYLEKLAGYLNINSYNPFTAVVESSTADQTQTDSNPDNQLESLKRNMKPQTPVASPQQSPNSSRRILSGSCQVSASSLGGSHPLPIPEIEIRIQSPSAPDNMDKLGSTSDLM